MKALDLYCGAGGAGQGLADAGFEVFGVDMNPQKNYPFEFHLEDVLKLSAGLLSEFDFIWASPPCQAHSCMTKRWGNRKIKEHLDLIPDTRKLLNASGVPYVIENVVGAPLINPVMLCGSMFGLQTQHGSQLRRHRLFEATFPIEPLKCKHNKGSVIGVYGGGQHPERRIPPTICVCGHQRGKAGTGEEHLNFGIQDRRDAMGIQWMTGKELSQAIPPAYSKYIAEQFLKSI